MRKLFYASILFLITHFCFSQNVNFIIQVNDRLLNNGEIANLYLTTKKENDAKKYYVNYNNNLIFENSYNLNIKNFKREINNLLNIWDSNSLLNFTSDKSFDVFNEKQFIIQWINNCKDFDNKNSLLDYFIKLEDAILFSYSKVIFIEEIFLTNNSPPSKFTLATRVLLTSRPHPCPAQRSE